MRDGAPAGWIAAADQVERQRLEAGIVPDQHEVAGGRTRLPDDRKQRGDGRVIEVVEKLRLGLGFERLEGEPKRLPRAPRAGAKHEIGDEAALREKRTHSGGGLFPARGQRPVEIIEAGIGPVRFGMAEEGQGEHEHGRLFGEATNVLAHLYH